MSLVHEVCKIAEAAGRAIMAIYADETLWNVQKKEDASPLTAADMAAHRLIAEALASLTPDIPLISEESSAADLVMRRQWSRCWVVDPLDGTKEFLSRNGEFCVNIALVENQRAVLGVVHAPVKALTYHAVAGEGAFLTEADGTVRRLSCRPLVAGRDIIIVASRHHGSENEKILLDNIRREFGEFQLKNFGSAFKTCLVAEGGADCYPRFGPTMEWDTAAPQVVLEEAGGQLLSPAGEPFRYNARDTLTNHGFVVLGDQAARWLSCWPAPPA
jgi:3'(2'), 5'-bisphosphate nucleotidase